ncbi:hypothetical protein [Deinococcus sp.]|uniref:hypothetical protein n=1 Tax=Deinococcus sp. TaxID=47478 RepID=UPI002869A68A|nr:hypothetical protein [Deinococcus sp.]
MTGMVLASVIAATTQVSLGTRRTAADDATSARLLLGAESGMAHFLDCTRQGVNFGNATNASTLDATLVNNACTAGGTLKIIPVADATVTMNVARTVPATFSSLGELTAVDITSTATSGTSRSSVTQRFAISRSNLPRINVPGAVTSYPGVDLKGASEIDGADITGTDNSMYASYLGLKRLSNLSVTRGSPVVMDASGTPASKMASLQVGNYVRMPLVNGATGSVVAGSPTGLFRIDAKDLAANTLTLTPTSLAGSLPTPFLPSTTGADLILNALKGVTSTSMTIQNTENFVQGDKVSVALGVPPVSYMATISSPPVASGANVTFNVTWPPLATPNGVALATFDEGQPVRKSTFGVVSAGSYSATNNATLIGGEIDRYSSPVSGNTLVSSPLNDALFMKTFGTTPADLKSMATVMTSSQFSGAVSNVTWVQDPSATKVNLNSTGITGSGIVVIDGDLTINQSKSDPCGFSGVLYVRGNVNIQGNIQMCGAIVVEGTVTENANNQVISVGSSSSEQFAGNGKKITYDPRVLFDVTQGTGKITFATVAGTWRQQ